MNTSYARVLTWQAASSAPHMDRQHKLTAETSMKEMMSSAMVCVLRLNPYSIERMSILSSDGIQELQGALSDKHSADMTQNISSTYTLLTYVVDSTNLTCSSHFIMLVTCLSAMHSRCPPSPLSIPLYVCFMVCELRHRLIFCALAGLLASTQAHTSTSAYHT